MQIHLAEDAANDVTEIYRYSVRQFGWERADRYMAELENCLTLLARNPMMGKAFTNIREGLRRHHHKSHVIYYRTERNAVRILRILGAAQDPARHL